MWLVDKEKWEFIQREVRRYREQQRAEQLRRIPIIKHILLPLDTAPFELDRHWSGKTARLLAAETSWRMAFSWTAVTDAFAGRWFKVCTVPVVVLCAFATAAHILEPFGVTFGMGALPTSVKFGLGSGICAFAAYLLHWYYCPPACKYHRERADLAPNEAQLQQMEFEVRSFLADQITVRKKEIIPEPSNADEEKKSPLVIRGPMLIEPVTVGLAGGQRNYLLIFLARLAEHLDVGAWQSRDDPSKFEQFSSGLRIYYAPGRDMALPHIGRATSFECKETEGMKPGDIVVEWRAPQVTDASRLDEEVFDRMAANTGVGRVIDVRSYGVVNRFFSEWQQYTHPRARIGCRVLMFIASVLSVSVITYRVILFLVHHW